MVCAPVDSLCVTENSRLPLPQPVKRVCRKRANQIAPRNIARIVNKSSMCSAKFALRIADDKRIHFDAFSNVSSSVLGSSSLRLPKSSLAGRVYSLIQFNKTAQCYRSKCAWRAEKIARNEAKRKPSVECTVVPDFVPFWRAFGMCRHVASRSLLAFTTCESVRLLVQSRGRAKSERFHCLKFAGLPRHSAVQI